jgi:hypothetical protein
MTMHRRPLGGGRTLASVAGALVVVGCILPWWSRGGVNGIPAASGAAFEDVGIVVFLVGLATLALVTLPYAVGDRPTGIDRWASYAILAVVGWAALAWRLVQLLAVGAFRFTEPAQVFTNGPGLWLAGLGLAVLSRAVWRMTREPLYR